MEIYSVYFDESIMKLNADVIRITASSMDELYTEINKILNSSGIDYFDYNKDITILVDREGFFKEGLAVFEIKSEYGDINHLAGRLLFVRNIENEFSTDIGSIKCEDIINLRNQLNIKFIGFTRGVK